MKSGFKCKIVSPAGILFEGDAWQCSARDSQGAFSIRAMHRDCLSLLAPGCIEVARTEDDRTKFKIGRGLLSFRENRCLIVAEPTS